MTMKRYNINADDVIKASLISRTGTEAAQYLGVNYKVYRRIAKRLGCWIKNQGFKVDKVRSKYVTLDAIVLHGEVRRKIQGTLLMGYLLSRGLKKYICEECGIVDWNGKKLTLQVHHKDGDHYNNYIDNLQVLCPNCHSQTDTYCKKNKIRYPEERRIRKTSKVKDRTSYVCRRCGKTIRINQNTKRRAFPLCRACSQAKRQKIKRGGIPRPPKEILLDLVSHSSYMSIARKYHVSNTTVKRWCVQLGIPLIKRTNRQFG